MNKTKHQYISQELLERQTSITRLITFTTSSLVLLMAYVCYFHLGVKEYLHFILLPFSIGAVLNYFLFKIHKKLFYAYLVLICLSYIEIIGISSITGGLRGHFIFILVTLPINAAITSRKQGIYWIIICLASIIGLFVLEKMGVEYPNIVPEEHRISFNFIIDIFVIIVVSLLSLSMTKSSFKIYKAKDEISNKNRIIEEKSQQITDSISYAKRIQDASLPSEKQLSSIFKEYFVYYKPKDIVSGDFYWVHQFDNGTTVWIVADCTGHGVPGAFMSLIGMLLLNDIVVGKKITNPKEIAELLSEWITNLLDQKSGDETTKDGMDIMICSFDHDTKKLTACGAYNSLFLCRNNDLMEFKGAKRAIGYNHVKKEEEPFIIHNIDTAEGDVIYMFSDGYVDQKGGQDGKKFFSKRFKALLLDIADKPLSSQKKILSNTMNDWKNGTEQIDDMLIFGVKLD